MLQKSLSNYKIPFYEIQVHVDLLLNTFLQLIN